MTTTITGFKCDTDEYSVAIRNISKARPRVNVDAWTEFDAAAWWYRDYNPDAHNALPPQLITGIVARLFVSRYHKMPPVGNFLVAATKVSRVLKMTRWDYEGVPNPIVAAMGLNDLVAMVQAAYSPRRDNWNSGHDPIVAVYQLSEESTGYCHRKSCKEQHSYLGGCINERHFDRLIANGYLVPWHSVSWGGLGVLMTPARHAIDTPYTYVRRERSHVKINYVPYYVADGINNLHRMVPQLMQEQVFLEWAKGEVRKHVAALETERLRFHGVIAMHPECEKLMRQWDYSFACSCWMFGKRDATYESYPPHWFGVDSGTYDKLQDTEPDDLFPKIPECQYEYDE